jgi:hypothetical protein
MPTSRRPDECWELLPNRRLTQLGLPTWWEPSREARVPDTKQVRHQPGVMRMPPQPRAHWPGCPRGSPGSSRSPEHASCTAWRPLADHSGGLSLTTMERAASMQHRGIASPISEKSQYSAATTPSGRCFHLAVRPLLRILGHASDATQPEYGVTGRGGASARGRQRCHR